MVKVLQHHTVVRNGWHNMLTTMAYWQDYYWLAYRRVSGHYSHDGGIVILRSVDLKRWHEVTYIKTIGCDWAPHFCLANNRLFLYFFTNYPHLEGLRAISGELIPRSMNPPDSHSQVCFTDDGVTWSEPTPAIINQWMFGITYNNGAFYGVAYSWQSKGHDHIPWSIHGPIDLLKSKNGVNWTKISSIASAEDRVDEADLHFQPDGELWVISATYKNPKNHSLFLSSKPPYHTWERVLLNTRLSSPCFCKSGDNLYVAGRRWMDELWIPQPIPSGNLDCRKREGNTVFCVTRNR